MEDLQLLRYKIDIIDNKLLKLIAERLKLVKEIGGIKKQINKEVRDPKREEEKIEDLSRKGKTLGLNKGVISKIWKTFFEVAYEVEK